MKEQLKEIIEHYGVMKQLKYFQSEVFELNEAIIIEEDRVSHMKTKNWNVNHIAEEIANVWIMLTQFKEYYGISTEEIDKIIDYKVSRQLERIKNEYK
jgi:NTP pyrophosphatase (non-canonical NTP hydrolase)